MGVIIKRETFVAGRPSSVWAGRSQLVRSMRIVRPATPAIDQLRTTCLWDQAPLQPYPHLSSRLQRTTTRMANCIFHLLFLSAAPLQQASRRAIDQINCSRTSWLFDSHLTSPPHSHLAATSRCCRGRPQRPSRQANFTGCR